MSIHEYTENLREARNRAWSEASELLERVTAESREMTGEEQAKWDAANADIDAKDTQIRSFEDREARERENAVGREAAERILSPSRIENRDKQRVTEMFDFLRGERRTLDIDLSGAARERKAVRSGLEARDLSEDVTTAGGYTVPTNLERKLYDFLEFYTGARQLGITVLTTSAGEALDIPTVATHGTAAQKGEGTAFAEAEDRKSVV